MAEKKERLLTPVGEAKWAHLQTPKPPFEGKGSPKYMVDVIFDVSNKAWGIWLEKLEAKLAAMPPQKDKKTGKVVPQQSPVKLELDANDEPTGRQYVTFKTNDRFKPGVFDQHGGQIETPIGNGSKVRVSYTENEYQAFGGGINLYLNAVQVVELVEYATRDAAGYGFDVVEKEAVDESEIPF